MICIVVVTFWQGQLVSGRRTPQTVFQLVFPCSYPQLPPHTHTPLPAIRSNTPSASQLCFVQRSALPPIAPGRNHVRRELCPPRSHPNSPLTPFRTLTLHSPSSGLLSPHSLRLTRFASLASPHSLRLIRLASFASLASPGSPPRSSAGWRGVGSSLPSSWGPPRSP